MFEKASTVTLSVGGMHCVHCQARVNDALKGIKGVKKVAVDLENGKAVVDYLPSKVNPDSLTAAVNAVGFTAEILK